MIRSELLVLTLLMCLRKKGGTMSIFGYTHDPRLKKLILFWTGGITRFSLIRMLRNPKNPKFRSPEWRASRLSSKVQSAVQQCTRKFLKTYEGIRFWKSIPFLTEMSHKGKDCVLQIKHKKSELPDARYWSVFKEILRLCGYPFRLSKVNFKTIEKNLDDYDGGYCTKSIYSHNSYPGYTYAYIGRRDFGRIFCFRDETKHTVDIHHLDGSLNRVITANPMTRLKKRISYEFYVVYYVDLKTLPFPHGKSRSAEPCKIDEGRVIVC